LKVVKLAGDGRELQNCGSQILKVRNRSSTPFLVRNSAIDLIVRNIAELRRCGLKLRMPTFGKLSQQMVRWVDALFGLKCRLVSLSVDGSSRHQNCL
jgi:hypothetical protein